MELSRHSSFSLPLSFITTSRRAKQWIRSSWSERPRRQYLECQYRKCEEGIPAGQVCIVKNDELWYHLICAFNFKENLGSAPTDIPGFQELSEDERATVVASFEGATTAGQKQHFRDCLIAPGRSLGVRVM